ncbi:TPA: hypothetical protein L9M66_004187 [Klebsiella quasipneumoniae subsp. quasipneumoniae]|nr:hypothetical protein [Klebsiella quasipneumoniae subsp. quasipneumoniae]
MASTEKIFTLSYDELLEHTKKVVTDFRNLSTPPDILDIWSNNGVIVLWRSLVEAMGVPGKDYLSDLRQLKSLGGLNFCDQDSTHDTD